MGFYMHGSVYCINICKRFLALAFSSPKMGEYRQKIENVFFCWKNKILVTHSLAFRKRKGNLLEKLFFLLKKKITKVKWEIPKEENLVSI